jgi:glycerophosphoryl diester phosphodiesterase
MTRPLVIAHRGASRELAENTMPAFERAIEIGADFVEFRRVRTPER